MPVSVRVLRASVCALFCVAVLSCGGGGLSPSTGGGGVTPVAANVVNVVVDSGPLQQNVNTLFTTVTVCVPGSTTNCQTIDHIQVDTASFGLRILAPVLTLNLPVQNGADGNPLLECADFVDGFSWGPVSLADVQISGESASSVPVQVIGDSHFTNIPADCSGVGPEEDTVADFGANGILGIGVFAQDCGSFCVTNAGSALYYSCTSTACIPTTVPLANQVPNPITKFAVDNNGTFIQLPSVSSPGAVTLTGSMTFGVDTQSNNQSGTETVLSVDGNQGFFTTIFNGQTLSTSFLDTGSNGIYFSDSSIQVCADSHFTGFYCPASSLNLSGTLQGQNSVSTTVNFTVGNAQTIATSDPTFSVLPTLAGSFPTAGTFDWGLPFYYGRRVATVLENRTTSGGTGPYVAF
jgi:Protein of unknown function (DUF3443)